MMIFSLSTISIYLKCECCVSKCIRFLKIPFPHCLVFSKETIKATRFSMPSVVRMNASCGMHI